MFPINVWPPRCQKGQLLWRAPSSRYRNAYLRYSHPLRWLEWTHRQIRCWLWGNAWWIWLGHNKHRGRQFTWACRVLQPGHRQHLFKKRPNHLITFTSGERRTQMDYVLFRDTLCKHAGEVKVISSVHQVFRLGIPMRCRHLDVQSEKHVRNDTGEVCLDDMAK